MFVLKSRFDKLHKILDDALHSRDWWKAKAENLQSSSAEATASRDYWKAQATSCWRELPSQMHQEVERIKLAPHMYDILMKNTLGAGVPKDELEAGFRLGVEFLAKKLREGFVV